MDKNGNPVYDFNSLPSYLKETHTENEVESEWLNTANMVGFSWGCIKELLGKHENLEQVVIAQSIKITELETEINLLKG